ncbi:MAG TPA: PDZ domain-containing protein, partial [Candidatus Acidoferrum sp.]|nr:PDZ domain-containing protein [Candidatus Acidoferrum sp.]
MLFGRYPWRVVAVSAISLIGNVFLGYYMLFGLASDGVSLDEKAGWVVVTDVGEQTAAARAGVQRGDKILSVDGQQIVTVVDWLAQRMNFAEGRPVAIHLQRGDRTLDATLVIYGRIWDEWSNSLRTSNVIFLAYKLITLAIGLFVVFSRPRDLVSRLGGWVLVVMATVFEAFQWGLSASTRSLPLLAAVPVMLVYVSAAFRTPLLAAFFCLYPKRLFVNRWMWTGFCAGPVVATIYALYLFGRTVYDPEHLTALTPSWVLLVFGVQSLAYLGAVLVVLPLSYWKLETVTDRRRFRVLVFGAMAA